MSLNTAHVNDEAVLLYVGEQLIIFSDHVILEFQGQSQAEFKGTKNGRIYLTTHRMIFMNKKKHDTLKSFSFPFILLSDVGIEQPVFGANYIKGVVTAQRDGNWTGSSKFKLVFKNGGAIDFGQTMARCAAMAQKNAGQGQPPPYVMPTGPFYPAAPPAYTPEPSYYGWAPPTHAFPETPPANSMYMTNSPPPYSGIFAGGNAANPYAGAASAPPQPVPDTKAAEAAQSAYYDPNRPQFAYVPPPAYYESPPSYEQAMTKKNE